MSDYPLIKKLGIKLVGGISTKWVDADELEKVLVAAPIYHYCGDGDLNPTLTLRRFGTDTHQARAILMEPIHKTDTAESLIKEMLGSVQIGADAVTKYDDWVKRARRVVGNPE